MGGSNRQKALGAKYKNKKFLGTSEGEKRKFKMVDRGEGSREPILIEKMGKVTLKIPIQVKARLIREKGRMGKGL